MSQYQSVVTAVFVDFDNLRFGVPDPYPKTDSALEILLQMQRRLEREGQQILIRRAYADWEGDGLQGVQGQLSLMSYLPVFVLGQPGKNSADLEMSLDCMDILLSRDDVERFVLVAGDRDFIPIVRRIIEAGKQVKIAAFRASTSADLVEIAGRRNFVDVSRFMDDPRRRDPHGPSATASMTATRTIEEALAEPDEEPYEPTDEDLERAMQLVVQADRKYRGRGIWLVPFFKEWMNPEFAGMNNESRKAILSTLSNDNAVVIDTREDGLGRSNSYSVLVPDREHVRYKKAEGSVDTEPTATAETELAAPVVEVPVE
ncbi:MAG: NYN domain-containing protein [Myxococcota bacterium]|nr:NYN domain-containing protein [Myxococcota bacterium]